MRNKIFVLSVVLMIMTVLTCKGPVEEPVEEAEKAADGNRAAGMGHARLVRSH